MSDINVSASRGKGAKKKTVYIKGKHTKVQWDEFKAKLKAVAKQSGLTVSVKRGKS